MKNDNNIQGTKKGLYDKKRRNISKFLNCTLF